VENAFDVALETGAYHYEARVIKPDQSICWIQTQGKVIYDAAGKPARLLGTVMDITEQKQSEEKFANSLQLFSHRMMLLSAKHSMGSSSAGIRVQKGFSAILKLK
jgi:hypothetical protein